MENNKNISNSPAPSPVSLSGFLLMLILLNPVIFLKEICSNIRAIIALFVHLLWGDRNKPSTHKNVTRNLQMEKKPEATSSMETSPPELSLEGLKIVMEKLGTLYDPDAEKLQDSMSSVEITELFEEQEPSLQEVKEAFCIFDENNDGFIDAAELKKVISTLSSTIPIGLDCASMIRAYDNNGDGVIDFNEFLQIVACSFS